MRNRHNSLYRIYVAVQHDRVLYQLHELRRTLLDPFANIARTSVAMFREGPLSHLPGARVVAAQQALVHRLTKRYPKPTFSIDEVTAFGRKLGVHESCVAEEPFCRLLHFARTAPDASAQAEVDAEPRVLLVAPLSGHHSTLLRDTVRALVKDHDVYVTDWIDARDVPLQEGTFGLDDFVETILRFMHRLGADVPLHVVAVCQPTVAALGAVALAAEHGLAPAPRSLTLMGGPIDARKSPTEVNRFATERPMGWFESNMIHRVPSGVAAGRRVYPGFVQLGAFVGMNPGHHAAAYGKYFVDALRRDSGAKSRAQHEAFYDEYNAVLDLDAPFYLETVREVFQRFSLATGAWSVRGRRVRPEKITETAILTIEGENDDISGLGQTEAAHGLARSLAPSKREHFVVRGAGHYGIFSGSKWRSEVHPRIAAFIRRSEKDHA